MTKIRGFIAIEVDSFPKIIELENEIKNSGAIVKLVEPQNIHITLKFLGDTEENLIDKNVSDIKKDYGKDVEPESNLEAILEKGTYENPALSFQSKGDYLSIN